MDRVILRENYQIGDISRFKNDYRLKIFGKNGCQESHTISYTSQEVIDIFEDEGVEVLTTIEHIDILEGDSKALSSTGKRDINFLPLPDSDQTFPQEELNKGDKWEREISMLLTPSIKWPSGNTIPMKIFYTLEGFEEVHKSLCARIKLDSTLIIDVPGQNGNTQQVKKASGYNYFSPEEGKLFKATSNITNVITVNGKIELETAEELIIDLIDFDWN